jgi:hypothetical protein
VLDDRERAKLREIQRMLTDEDPVLASVLRTGARHLPRPVARVRPDGGGTVQVALCSAAWVIMLAAGQPFFALLFALLTGWAWYEGTRRAGRHRR